ncbi:MAG: hypothetical protein WA045_07125, partial [Nitrospira sp.]
MDSWRLVILGVWVGVFLVLGRLVYKLEQRRTASGTAQSLAATRVSTSVPVVAAQKSPRVTVKV